MISRLKFSTIAVIMLVLVAFGFQHRAIGQVPPGQLPFDLGILETGGPICPLAPHTTGYLEFTGFQLPLFDTGLSAGLIGTVENSGFEVVGGLDWMQADLGEDAETFEQLLPTYAVGTQLVSWYDQSDGRNTYIQVTNTRSKMYIPGFVPPAEQKLSVHVTVIGENCLEVINFCDEYTGWDTHEYDLGNFFANNGDKIPDILDGEGFVVVTPVVDCDKDERQAVNYNFLSGQLVLHDSDDYLYGVNLYARQSVCFGEGDEPDDLHGGCVLGDDGEFDTIDPDKLYGQFNVLPGNDTAGSDLVFINFTDLYDGIVEGDGYLVLPGLVALQTDIYDEFEFPLSCPLKFVCYGRFGIDAPIVPSGEFVPVTPTPTPTITPSPGTPTPGTPTPTPTGGGSSSCSIAASPVQLGTALANVLIPLVPVAFAFGVRAVRRRKK